MLHKILLGLSLSSASLLPQLAYAVGGADVAAPMRWAAAAHATNPAGRCANFYGSQYSFLGPNAPNCVQPHNVYQMPPR